MLTVIVPVCNAERYLPQCLESIFAQTHRDLEVIVVDDGSTDGSGVIADDIARRESRLRVIHQPNAGVSSARNAGLRNARGEFVAFVDADDTIAPAMYATMLANIGGCDLVMCNLLWVEPDGRELPMDSRNGELLLNGGDWLAELIAHRLMSQTIPPSPCNKIYRREILSAAALAFDETLARAEDIDFNARVFAAINRARYLPQPFYRYRRHAGNATERFRPADLNEAEVWRRLERLVAHRPDLVDAVQSRKAWMVFYFTGLNALDPGRSDSFHAWHPERFAAIQREAAQVPNLLGRLAPQQRELYLRLCALYQQP